MPIATIPVPPEPVAALESAPQLCGKCGAALAPGKRFCKQCGQAVGQPTPVVEQTLAAAPTEAAVPAAPVCIRCGADLVPGKRFCKLCGQAVDSIAPPVQVLTGFSEQGVSPARQPAVPVPIPAPAEVQVSAQDEVSPVPGQTEPAEEPDVVLDSQGELAPVWTSTLSPEEPASPLSSLPLASTASLVSFEREPALGLRSKMKLGLAIGVAAAVLIAAGGVLAWHLYAHRGVSSGTKASESQQGMVKPPAQNPQATGAPQQQPKPSPGIQEHPVSNPPQSHVAAGATTPLSPPATIPVSVSHQHAQTVTQQPTIVPAPLPPPVSAPVAPHSGVLHYQGPPVPLNGVVVFDHLPKARLRFTFDHQAWSLILKPNPDGTKKATLISLAPGYQTSCDLVWEIVQ
jgi:hypothetical protein